MTQDFPPFQASRLSSFDGSGHLEAGSRLMWIGMDHHDPYEALKRLTEEPHSMSVAIHEITHFRTLRNSLGRALTLQGQLASFWADPIHELLTGGEPHVDVNVDWFLFLRIRHELMLRTWTPLLEGLAVYAQTAEPCRQLDELNPAVESLLRVAVALAALDGRGAKRPESLNALTNGVLEAAYRSMEFGPSLVVDNRALAAAIELPSSRQWLPYFLGHSYVRAIADRLIRRTDEFACPEKFLPLITHFINSSSYRIQRGEPNPENLGYIRQIYGWIEAVSAAPADRLQQALNSPTDLDILHFLRTGERVSDNDAMSADRNSASLTTGTVAEALSSELSTIEPTAWRAFSKHAENMSAFSAKKDPPGWTVQETKARMVSGIIFGVESLNFSSGGTALLAGIRLHALGGNHAIGVRVADATWWIMLTDAELQDFPWNSRGIPSLASTDDPLESWTVSEAGIPVTLDVFLSYASFPASEAIRWRGQPVSECLIQFGEDEDRALFKVRPAPEPHHRAVLRPVDMTSSMGALLGANALRDMSSGAVSASLKDWAEYLRRHGEVAACDKMLSAHRKQELAASRIDQVVARKILSELLRHYPRQSGQRAIITDGMRGVVPETTSSLELLAAAYSGPCFVGEYMGGKLDEDLAEINSISLARIGKAVFDLDASERTVRYLGLWG